MQRLPGKAAQHIHQRIARAFGQARPTGISGVAHQRVANMGHMHTNLVGAAGFKKTPHVAVVAITFLQAIMRNRLLAAKLHHRHFCALLRVTPHWLLNLTPTGHAAHHNGVVFAVNIARLQLRHQVGVGLQRFGNHHEPGGIAVETVHDTRARHAINTRAVTEQGIQQGAAGITGTRVNNQASGLIDHDNIVVFIDDIQRYRLGLKTPLGLQLRLQGQHVAFVNFVPRAAAAVIGR